MIHLVIIRFDRGIKNEIPSFFLKQFDSINIVWTSEKVDEELVDINRCFEFSGYQEGLRRLLNDLESVDQELLQQDEVHHAVIFVNDTIFTGHLSLMSNFMLDSLIFLGKQGICDGLVTGLVMPFDQTLSCPSVVQTYFSSWIFMIEGNLKTIRTICFYEQDLDPIHFSSVIQPCLPKPYRDAVDGWLQPKSMLRGWYKAIPGKNLSIDSLKRKQFTIYLEHRLYQYLESQGFSVACISDRIGRTRLVALKILRLLDRIYVNLIKLYTRLSIHLGS